MKLCALPTIAVTTYTPHALHAADANWPETNCYIDIWIEILHALGLNPLACLGMVFANDFDGDQWTFYKPPHEDLHSLYGIDVQELNVWRSLLANASTQLQRGRMVLAETDAYYLPDTQSTDYRTNHVKTSIAIQEIDLERQRLGYFHNSSYHELHGEDFIETFRVGKPCDPSFMPFFAEFIRLDRVQRYADSELAKLALNLVKKHFARRPQDNPITQFVPVFLAEVERLKVEGMPAYHAYAFANLRQLGAGYSLGAAQLRWLSQHGQGDLLTAATHFAQISDISKTLLLKTARTVMSKKATDLSPQLEQLGEHWQSGMTALHTGLEQA